MTHVKKTAIVLSGGKIVKLTATTSCTVTIENWFKNMDSRYHMTDWHCYTNIFLKRLIIYHC